MKTFALVLLGTLAVSSAAFGQTLPECNGHYEVIRMDAIKPGKWDAFRKAVADHQAWYKAHGLSDRIVLARVLVPGLSPAFSADTAMTIHIESPGTDAAVEKGLHDAGWKAFVAEYQDSSTLTQTTIVCVEDHAK